MGKVLVPNRKSPQARGLRHWWPMRDADYWARDYAGAQNLDVPSGSFAQRYLVPHAERGRTLEFNVNNSAATPIKTSSPLSSVLDNGGSVAYWHRLELTNSSSVVFGTADWDTSRDGIIILNRDNFYCTVHLCSASASQSLTTDESAVAAYRLYHCVVTWGDGYLRIYRDGVLLKSAAQTVTPAMSVRAACIGDNAAGGSRPIRGWLDDLRVYNRPLTAQEVWGIYNPRTRFDLFTYVERRGGVTDPILLGDESIGVADTAVGSDSVVVDTGSTDKPVDDTGSGTETPTIDAAVPVADTGSGSEAPTVGAAVPAADTGAGSETPTIAAAVPAADTGSGSEAPTVGAAVPAADTGSGTEAPTVAVAVGVSDTGAGSDSALSDPTVPASDTGSGSEGVVVYVSIDVGDAGSGVESAAGGTGAVIGDAGTGVDGIDVAVTVGLSDTGTGTDSRALGADVGVADTATGVDTGSGVAGAFITDFGSGVEEVLVAVGLGLSDAGAGLEAAGVAAACAVADGAVGFDFPAVPESHPPYNTPIRVARLRGTISRTARLQGGARIAKPTPPED